MPALRKGITSRHDGDFYCLNWLCSYGAENHENVVKIMTFLKGDNNILKYNHGEKSMKVWFIIYADFEALIEKMITCHNNLNLTS